MSPSELTYADVAELAFEVVGFLVEEEEGDVRPPLDELATELDRLVVLDEPHVESLARCARRSPLDVPVWLRATGILCRLVQAQQEEPDELVERLFALHWAWRELPEDRRPRLATDDVALLWSEVSPLLAAEGG